MIRKLQAIATVSQSLIDRLSEETWAKLEAIDIKARAPYLAAERIRKEIEALNKKLMAEIKRIDAQEEDAHELIGLEGQATLAERLMCFPESKARRADQEEAMSPYMDIATLTGYWSDTGQKVIMLNDCCEKKPTVDRVAEVMGALIEHVTPNPKGDRRFMVANSRHNMALTKDGVWRWDCSWGGEMTLEKAALEVHAVITDRDREWEEN